MRTTLIQAVQQIAQQQGSGLLMAVVTIAAQADDSGDMVVCIKNPEFSFFFKSGQLVSVMCRGLRGGTALARVAFIESVIRTQWTPLSPNSMAVTDHTLGTSALLEALGASKLAPPTIPASVAQAHADTVLALRMRSEVVFAQVMGERGDAALKRILARYDPNNDIGSFTAACVVALAPMAGVPNAKAMMTPPKINV